LRHVPETPVQLKQASDRVIFRGLVGPSESAAILSNWGETQTVIVSFKGIHKIRNAITGQPAQVTTDQGNTIASVRLAAGASAVLMTE
jgi:hypothetical protein